MGRMKEIAELAQAAIAMGYSDEDACVFIRKYSRRPKPSMRYIQKILEEIK